MRDYVREQAAKIRQKQGVQEDMEQIVVQINELARQLNAQMDTRFAKLEQVIAEADEKIATLEGLLRQAAGSRAWTWSSMIGAAEEAAAAGEAPPPPRQIPQGRQEGAKAGKAVAKSEAAASKADGAPAKSDPAAPADPDALRYGRIYALADQGLPIVEIARQTGQTTGEIELILNLRKSR